MNKKRRAAATIGFVPLYAFTLVFVLCPMLYMVLISFFEQDEWSFRAVFTLDNYINIFSGTYLTTMLNSLKLAVISTLFIILIGYSFAMCVAAMPRGIRNFFVTLQMIPYWVNSLLRLYGWIIVFRSGGIADSLAMALGLTSEPLKLLYSYPLVVIGMVYVLVPFMFTSVFQVAEQLDPSMYESARDLGAGRVRAFFTVIFPLTLPGLKTGIIHTFIPCMGLFFVADILGGNKIVLTGSLIYDLLNKAHDYPQAAAMAFVLTLMTGAVCALMMRRPRYASR